MLREGRAMLGVRCGVCGGEVVNIDVIFLTHPALDASLLMTLCLLSVSMGVMASVGVKQIPVLPLLMTCSDITLITV